MFSKKFLRIPGFVAIAAGIFAFVLSCENPFKAGLGPKVDILAPVIREVLPTLEDFIRVEKIPFRARVTDDIKVADVYITFWRPGESEPQGEKWADVKDNPKYTKMSQSISREVTLTDDERDPDVWVYFLDVKEPPLYGSDGELLVKIIAVDVSDPPKTDFKKMSYTVKNFPPAISISYPYIEEEFWDKYPSTDAGYNWTDKTDPTINYKPTVYLRDSLRGIAVDAQGIRPKTPEIKIWKKGAKEPDAYTPMTAYTGMPPTIDWKQIDPVHPDWQRIKNVGFEYALFDQAGNPLEASEDPYFFRIRAWDTGAGVWETDKQQAIKESRESYYPPLDKAPAEVFITAESGTPKIDVYFNKDIDDKFVVPVPSNFNIHKETDSPKFGPFNKDSPYGQDEAAKQKFAINPFVVEARVRYTRTLNKAVLHVKENSSGNEADIEMWQDLSADYNKGNAVGSPATDPRWILNNKNIYEREYLFLSRPIENGTILKTLAGSTFEFKEDEYEFSFRVLEEGVEDQLANYTEKNVVVRITTTGPTLDIISVSPNTKEIYSGTPDTSIPGDTAKTYNRYEVNGWINVNWVIDAGYTGIATDDNEESPDVGRQLKKYLVSTELPPSDPADIDYEAILNDPKAIFLEASPTRIDTLDDKMPLYGPNVTNRNSPNPKTYYFYIAAQDKAGIVSGAYCEITVDQTKDFPEIIAERPEDFSVYSQSLMTNDNASIIFHNSAAPAATNNITVSGLKIARNSMGRGAAIAVNLSDDDGLDLLSGMDYKLFEQNGTPVVPARVVDNIPNSNDARRRSFKLNDNLSGLPDGYYYFTLMLGDSYKYKNEDAAGYLFDPKHDPRTVRLFDFQPSSNDGNGQVWFLLDTEPPEVRARSFDTTASGIYSKDVPAIYNKPPFEFHVEARDTAGLTAIIIFQRRTDIANQPWVRIETIDKRTDNTTYLYNDSTPNFNVSDPDPKNRWYQTQKIENLPRDPDHPENYALTPDGTYEYTVVAIDKAGGQSDLAKYTFTADSGTPVIRTINYPPAGQNYQTADFFTITGKMRDRGGLSKISYVYWTLTSDAATPAISITDPENPTGVWKKGTAGGEDWSVSVESSHLTGLLGSTGEGRFWLHVVARDDAGNLSDPTVGTPGKNNWPIANSNDSAITAEVGKVEIYVDTKNSAIVWNPSYSYPPTAADPYPPANEMILSEGYFGGGNVLKSGEIYYARGNYNFAFTAVDSFALRTVKVERKVGNGAFTEVDIGSSPLITAKNRGGYENGTRFSRADYPAPMSSIQFPDGTNGTSLSDPSNSLNATAGSIRITDVKVTLSETIDTTNHTNDGDYTYRVTVTDFVGRPSQVFEFTVRVDTRNPVVRTIITPASVDGSSTFTATGLARDPEDRSNITHVYYRVDTSLTPAPTIPAFVANGDTAPTGWTRGVINGQDTGTSNWNWTAANVSGATGPQGIRYFHVAVRDESGRISTVQTGKSANNWPGNSSDPTDSSWKTGKPEVGMAGIYIDTANPTIAIGALSGLNNQNGNVTTTLNQNSVYYAKSNFSVTFTASDSYALRTVTVMRSGTATPLTLSNYPINSNVDLAGGGTGDSLSNPVNGTPMVTSLANTLNENTGNSLDEGTYTYTITVTDFVGKTAEMTFTVIVDTKPPVIGVINGDDIILSNSFNATGTARDQTPPVTNPVTPVTPITHVYWNISSESNTATMFTNFSTYVDANGNLLSAGTSAGWYKANGTNDWAAQATNLSTTNEGSRYFYVVARDAAGHLSTVKTGESANNWPDGGSWIAGSPEIGKKRVFIDLKTPELVWDKSWPTVANDIYTTSTYPDAGNDTAGRLNLTTMFGNGTLSSNPFGPTSSIVKLDSGTYYANASFTLTFTAIDTFALGAVTVQRGSTTIDLTNTALAAVTRYGKNGTNNSWSDSGYQQTHLVPDSSPARYSLSNPDNSLYVTATKIVLNETVGGVGGLDDGAYTYRITVIDHVKKEKVHSDFTVIVDRESPTVSLSNTTNAKIEENKVDSDNNGTYDSPLYTVNGVFRFDATIADTFGVTGNQYWLLPRTVAGGAVTNPDGTTYIDTNNAPAWWTSATDPVVGTTAIDGRTVRAYKANNSQTLSNQLIDTLGGGVQSVGTPGDNTGAFIPQGHYTLYIMALDKAGNIGHQKRYIYVDQETDKPKAVFSSPANNEFVQSASISLVGTVTDDDGVGSYFIDYESGTDNWLPLQIANSTLTSVTGETQQKYVVTLANTPKTATFNENLSTLLGNAQGQKKLRVTMFDARSARAGIPDTNRAEIKQTDTLTFTLDTRAPDLVWRSGYKYDGTEANASGIPPTGYPPTGSSDFVLSSDSGALGGGNWSGGNYYTRSNFTISFTALDSYALRSVAITRNNINRPLDSGATIRRYGTFNPSATPDYVTGQAGYTMSPGTSPASLSNPNRAGGADLITALAVTLNETVGTGTNELTDGVYTYNITVTDYVGRTNTSTFSVYVDTQPPVISQIDKLDPNAAVDTILSSSFSATGTVKDPPYTGANNGTPVTHVYWKVINDPNTANVFNNFANNIQANGELTTSTEASTWTRVVPGGSDWTALVSGQNVNTEGSLYFYAAARDAAGNISVVKTGGSANSESANNWPNGGSWAAGSPEIGKKQIFIDLKTPELVWDKSFNTYTNTATYPEGTDPKLNLTTMFGAGGNVSTNPFFDTNYPLSIVRNPDQTNYYANSTFTLTFTAIDTFALGTVTVQRNTGQIATNTPNLITTTSDATVMRYGTGSLGGSPTGNGYTLQSNGSLSDPDANIKVTAVNIVLNQALANGTYTYRITVKDHVGKEKIHQDFTVIVDNVAPTVSFTSTSNYSVQNGYVTNQPQIQQSLYTVNGVFDFNATLSDTYGVTGSKWLLIRRTGTTTDDDANPDWGTAAGATIGTAPNQRIVYAGGTGDNISVGGEIDTFANAIDFPGFAIPDEAHYTLYIMAQDKAGNTGYAKRYIYVNQATDLPTISFTSPVGPNGTEAFTSQTTITLTGRLTDDDGIASYTVQYWSGNEGQWAANPRPENLWINVTGLIDLPGGSQREMDLTATIPNTAAISGDGLKHLRVIVKDAYASKLGRDKTAQREESNRNILTFTRDVTSPQVAIDNNTNLFFSASATVSGTVNETNMQPAVIKWILGDGGVSPNVPVTMEGTVALTAHLSLPNPPNWSWSLTNDNTFKDAYDALPEGTHTLRLEVTDRALLTGSAQAPLTKDSKAPAITFNNITPVQITAAHVSNPDRSVLQGLLESITTITETPVATIRGGFSDEYSVLGKETDTLPGWGSTQYFYEYRIYNRLAGETPPTTWTKLPIGPSASFNSKTFTWTIDVSSQPDGIYWMDIKVSDQAGNSAAWTDTEKGTQGGVVENVVFAIDRKSPEVVWDANWANTNATTIANYPPISPATTDPKLSLSDMFAAATASPATAGNPFIAVSPVSVKKPAGDTNYYANGNFNLTFTAIDTFALGKVEVQRSGPDGTTNYTTAAIERWGTQGNNTYIKLADSTSLTALSNIAASTSIKTTAAKITINQSDLVTNLGAYTYRITVTDFTGTVKTIQDFTVIVDNTPPAIGFTSTSNFKVTDGYVTNQPLLQQSLYTVNGVFEFNATTSDTYGVTGSQWLLVSRTGTDTEADANPTWHANPNWSTIVGSSLGTGRTVYAGGTGGTISVGEPLAIQIDTRGGYNGGPMPDETHYTLYIMAQDKAGNTGYAKRYIYVDQDTDKPVVTFTSPAPSAFISAATITLQAKLKDDDNIGSYYIQYYDNGTWEPVWVEGSAEVSGQWVVMVDPPAREWDVIKDIPNTEEFGSDGVKQLRVVAMDDRTDVSQIGADINSSRMQTGNEELQFTRDKTPPRVEIANKNTLSFSATATVTGTMTETNMNPAEIRWILNDGTTITPTNPPGPPVNLSGTVTLSWHTPTPPATNNWTWLLTGNAGFDAAFGALPEGTHTLRMEATDRGGLPGSDQATITKDSKAPAITFNNIAVVQIPSATQSDVADLLAGTPSQQGITTINENSIRGAFNDEYSALGASMNDNVYYFEYRIYNRFGGAAPLPYNEKVGMGGAAFNSKTYNWTIPVTDLADGIYWLDIRVSDRANNSAPWTDGDTRGGEVQNVVFAIDRRAPEVVWDASWATNGTPNNALVIGTYPTTGNLLVLSDMFAAATAQTPSAGNPFTAASPVSVKKSSTDINYYVNGNFNIIFTAIDTFALDTVTVQRTPPGGGTPIDLPATTIQRWGMSNNTYQALSNGTDLEHLSDIAANPSIKTTAARITVNQTGLDTAPGAYTYRITVKDFAGTTKVINDFTVIVDMAPPVVNFTDTTAARVDSTKVGVEPLYVVNGVFRFNATASDAVGFESSKWWLVNSNWTGNTGGAVYPDQTWTDMDTAPTWATSTDRGTTGGVLGSRTVRDGGTGDLSLEALIDTLRAAPNNYPNGQYTLYVMAQDKAGNQNLIAKRYIYVDQETDKPTADISTPAQDSNITSTGSITLVGTITDDDGVGSYYMRRESGTNNWLPMNIPGSTSVNGDYVITVTTGLSNPNVVKTANINVPNILSYLGAEQGTKRIQIYMSDAPWSKLGDDKTRDATPNTSILTFTVDTEAPEVVWNPSWKYSGSNYGTLTPADFELDQNSTAALTNLNRSGATYYTNKNFTVKFTAVDTYALKSIKVDRSIDNGVNWTNRALPSANNTNEATGTTTTRFGTGSGLNYNAGADGYVLSITGTTEDPDGSLSNSATGVLVTAVSVSFNEGGAAGGLAEGAYRYRITVKDYVGREKETFFNVVVDRQAPVISTINVINPEDTPANDNVKTSSFSVTGTVKDPSERSPLTYLYWTIQNSNNFHATSTNITDFINADTGAVTGTTWTRMTVAGSVADWTALASQSSIPPNTEGNVYFYAVARDAAGNLSKYVGGTPGEGVGNWPGTDTDPSIGWITGHPEIGRKPIYIDIYDPQVVWDNSWAVSTAVESYPGAGNSLLNLNTIFKAATNPDLPDTPAPARNPFSTPVRKPSGENNYYVSYTGGGVFTIDFTAIDTFALESVKVERTNPANGNMQTLPNNEIAITSLYGTQNNNAPGTILNTSRTLNDLSDPAGDNGTPVTVTAAKIRLTQNGLTDNAYTYRITVTDTVGKEKAASDFTVIVDNAAPSVTISNLTNAGTTDGYANPGNYQQFKVNDVFQFNANVGDENGVDETRWWLLNETAITDAAPAWSTAPVAGGTLTAPNRTIYGGGSTKRLSLAPYIDTIVAHSTTASDGTTQTNIALPTANNYILFVMTMDKAGNTGTEKRYIRVDQDSDLPTVAITSPVANTYVGTSVTLRIEMKDDDNIGEYVLQYASGGTAPNYVWSDVPQNLVAVPGFYNPVTTVTANTPLPVKELTPSPTVTALVPFNTEGVKVIRVTVSDHDVTTNAPPSKLWDTAWGARTGRTQTVTSAEHQFTKDTTPPTVSFNAALTDPDNPQKFNAVPTIIYGGVNEAALDNIANPGTLPAQLKWTLNTGAAVSGTAMTGNIPVSGSSPSSNWTWTLASVTAFNNAFTALPDGTHTLRIEALDMAGQSGSGMITFTKDTEGPSISLNSPITNQQIYGTKNTGTGKITVVGNIAPNTIRDSTITLSGTFNDSVSAIYKADPNSNTQFWYKIDFEDDKSIGIIDGTWKQGDMTESADQLGHNSKYLTWKINVPGDTRDGKYLLSIRVKDSLGNGYGTTTQDNTAIAGLNAPNGYGSGFGYVENVAFEIDRSIPVLTVDPVAQYQKGTVSFNVTVAQVSSVGKLDVKQGSVALAEWTGVPATDFHIATRTVPNPDPTGRTFYYTVTLPTTGSRIPIRDPDNPNNNTNTVWPKEGSYNLVITATSGAGFISMDVRAFIYDNTPPKVDFVTPSGGQVYTGTFTNRTVNSNPQDGSAAWTAAAPSTEGGVFRVLDGRAWVTGSPTINGVTEDSNGIASISYHLGKLNEADRTDNNTSRTTNDNNRNAAYANPANWIATGLGEPGDNAPGWGGGLFNWNFTTNLSQYEFADSTVIDKYSTDQEDRSFYIPLYIKAADPAGNINITTYWIWVDPEMDKPNTTIINPLNNNDVGGMNVRVSGTASDNNMVHSVEIRIKAAILDPVLDAALIAQSVFAERVGNVEYRYYKDTAENEVWAYPSANTSPNADPPNANAGWIKTILQNNLQDAFVSWSYSSNKDDLLTPKTENTRRQVIIEARAIDTKQLVADANGQRSPDRVGEAVSITVYFAGGVPKIETPHVLRGSADTRIDVPLDVEFYNNIKRSGTFRMTVLVRDDGGINSLKAKVTGGSYQELVRNGGVQGHEADILQGGVSWYIGTGDTDRPTDITNITEPGWRYQLTNNPTGITWSTVDLDYATGKTYAVGTWIRVKPGISVPSGINGYRANYGQQVPDDSVQEAEKWSGQYFGYVLQLVVNSLANVGYGNTGKFTLDLQVVDNNTPQSYTANGSYSVDIDNFFPSAVIQTQYNAVTQNFYVKGTAVDYEGTNITVRGLARMLVYFQRGTTYYKANYNAAATAFTNGAGLITDRPNVIYRSGGYTGASPNANPADPPIRLPVLTNTDPVGLTGVWMSDHAMVIDRAESGADSDTDGDGTFAEIWDDDNLTKLWQARFDTKSFTDGPLTVHYVIMDDVGNATHYSENIYVGNNAPMIRDITLGTNLDGANTTTDAGNASFESAPAIVVGNDLGERFENGSQAIETNFRVRNNRFRLNINALYGNPVASPAKYYRVYYVTRRTDTGSTTAVPPNTPDRPTGSAEWELDSNGWSLIPSTQMKRGQVYTVANPGNTNWVSYGAFNNVTGVTFVATGPARAQTDGGDATVGTVYGYTGGTNPNSVTTPTTPGGTITIPSAIASQKTGTFTAGSSGNITFTNNSFGGNVNQTATIPDTPILNNPNDPANPLLRHDRYFIIKVFDSTQAGLTEDQQLAHVALINVDVNNGDSVTPVIYVAPFGQEYVLSNATGAVIESNASRVLGPVPAYTRNVVTTGLDGAGTKKGYVQYASHSNNGSYPNTTNANVSGMVIFKGKAADNGRIASIQAQIAGYNSGNWFEIAAWNAGTNTLAPSNSAVTIDTMRSSDANARGFDAEDNSLTLDYNHVVNWSFAWDTSTVTGVTATGTTVSFRVTDANNNTSVATTDAPYRSQTAVNIVPYITGIRSSLPSQFDRSAANGWYPVREGQSITINGFNLANGATKPTVNVGGTLNADGTITFPNPNTNGVNIDANRVSTPTSTRQLTVVIDNDNDSTNANGVNSGVLTLVVNGITSFNNRNNNSAALTNRVDGTGAIVQRYNREPTVTNTILTDNRGLYVWNTGALVNSNILSSPKMRMSDNATRYTSFGAYIYSATTGNSSVKVITNNTQLNANGEPQRGTNTTANPGTNEGSVMFYNNRFVNFGFGLTPQGEWGVAATNMTSTGATYTFAYNTLGLGSVAGASNNNGNRRLIMMAGADPDRVKYPSVAVRRPIAGTEPTNAASATRTVLAYYDSRNFSATMNGNNTVVSAANHPVLLHYGFFYNVNNGTNDTGYISGNANNTATGGQFPAQRAGNGNFNTATPPVAQNAIYNTTSDLLNNYGTIPDPNLVVADDTQKARGGEYVAAGLLSNGRAVVAWYDESIQSLWFSYGVNTPTTANGNPIAPAQTMTDWQNNAVIIKGSAGTHVDLAVDGGDNVHLAYVNPVDGGLWYSYIPYSGGVPNSKADSSNNSLVNSAVRTVRVDTYLSVGTKLMLNVREQGTGNYVPYITYIHNAFAETTNSVRVAWRNTTQANLAHGTDDDNAFTGAWEVMTVPAQTIPDTNEYVSNGVPGNAPNNNWVPGNSWSSLRAPGVGINNTILVGYMTKSWYEGAILKYNIRNAGVINVNQ